MKLLAKTFEGLEEVLATEIEAIGGTNIKKLTRAVSFEGDKKLMYTANYMLRTAIKILEVRKEFYTYDVDDLYRKMYKFPWDQIISLKDTFAVDATTSGETFTHSKFTALKTKDAIVDKIRSIKGERPNVNVITPTHRINVHIRDTTATVSFDTTGDSLHLRGYRITAVDAPLNEALAAGLVLLSGWDKRSTLVDPMCGSATILIEADRIARNVPPQKADRVFCFKKWKDFDEDLWSEVVQEQEQKIIDGPAILGFDKNLRAVKVSQQNIDEARCTDTITIEKRDFFKSEGHENAMIITNPPYDMRLKETDIEKYYKSIGDQLKKQYINSTAWIFSGNVEALKSVGLKPSRRIHLMNGGIEAKFYKFEMYAGTKN